MNIILGLFYRCLPNRSYGVDKRDARQNRRGTKAMKAKDRLTLVLCVNATGTIKIPPLLIGTAKKPHCFRNDRNGKPRECPLPYTHQKKAWVDKAIYRHWFHNVFLPEVRKVAGYRKVALLMDNCAGHDTTCEDPLGQVRVFFFPPNTTSVFQPLDQGMIAVFKARYKSKMLTKVVNFI